MQQSFHRGVSALLVVLVIGAASLVIAFTVSLVGILSAERSFGASREAQAFVVAQGCTDEAFRRIALDDQYGIGSGPMNLSVGSGSCIIEVTDTGGSTRQVVVTGNVTQYYSTITTTITRNGRSIQLTSWINN